MPTIKTTIQTIQIAVKWARHISPNNTVRTAQFIAAAIDEALESVPNTKLIEQTVNYTNTAADDMEGADWEDFIRAETRMGAGIDFLKLLGVKYNPITGKREPL